MCALFRFQANEVLAALHKTSQQVQSLSQIVNKGPSSAPLVRPPTQPLLQSGKCVCVSLCRKHLTDATKVLFLLFCRTSGRASGLCFPRSLSFHHPAQPKRARGRAPSRYEHSGKETHQDVAQRDPCFNHSRRYVKKCFSKRLYCHESSE